MFAFLGKKVEHRIEEQSKDLQRQGDDQRAHKHPVQLRSRLPQACIKNKSPLPLCSWWSPFCWRHPRQDSRRCCCPRTFRRGPDVPGDPDVAAAVTSGSSAATTAASCGSSDAAGGIGAAVAADGGTAVAEGAVAARGSTPNVARPNARATGTKASADGTGRRQRCHCCCSAAGTGTGPSCATGSVPGSSGRCWFSSPDCPSEPALAAESPRDYFRFSSDSVSSR